MAGPWEKYKAAPAPAKKPWEQFATTAPATPEAQTLPPPENQPQGNLLSPTMQGVTMGWQDEITGLLNAKVGKGFWKDYAKERDEQRNLLAETRAARPVASTVAEVGGSVAPLLIPGVGAATRVAGAGHRVAAGMATGAGQGAIYGLGAGEGDLVSQATSMGLGAGLGLAVGGLGTAAANRIATRSARKAIPSTEDIYQNSKLAFETADNSGVVFSEAVPNRLIGELGDIAEKTAYDPGSMPKARAVFRGLRQHRDRPMTWQDLEILRARAHDAANLKGANNGREAEIGRLLLKRIDEYQQNPALTRGNVLSGDITNATEGVQAGRQLWAQSKRSGMVDEAFLKARRTARSKGKDEVKLMQSNIGTNLNNASKSRGLTALERAAADDLVEGTILRRAGRAVGDKLSPTGAFGGISALMGGGGMGFLLGPGVGTATALGMAGVGGTAKALTRAATRRSAQRLSETIRSGGRTAEGLARDIRSGAMSHGTVTPQLARQAQIESWAVPGAVNAAEAAFLDGPRRKPRYR